MIQDNSFHLSDLFYYDPSQKKHANLQKGLKEYQFLLRVSISAIQNLLDGNLEKFDSLVGENACQIRAIKIALIASQDLSHFDRLKHKLTDVLALVDLLLSPHTINPLMHEGISLREILDERELDIALTPEEIFAIKSYILSEMKECQSDGEIIPSIFRVEKSVPSKLQEQYPDISYTFINRLASRLRRLLSGASVSFVRKAASALQDPALLRMVTEYALEHNTWPCIPMFWTYKTLLSLARKRGIPILLHVKFLNEINEGFSVVDEEYLYFKPCPVSESYIEISPTEKDLATPACIVQGIVCKQEGSDFPSKQQWKETIMKSSVVDVILAGAADHRQYPNPDQTVDILDHEYENYKKLAQTRGFSLKNPTTFFIQHVYSAQPNRKISIV